MDEIQTKIKSTRDAKHDLKEIPRMQRRVLAKPLAWYEAQSPSRDEGIVEAYLSGDYAMKEIAEWFGVHYSTVSRAIKRSEQND